MMKTSQKPIEYDIHLKYLCSKCGDVHWLSFREASTKQFKIVCNCGNVFTVKRVSSFKIKYKTKKPPKEQSSSVSVETIPVDILDQCVKILVSYGFKSEEASEILNKSYASNPISDVGSLIKQSLASLRT